LELIRLKLEIYKHIGPVKTSFVFCGHDVGY